MEFQQSKTYQNLLTAFNWELTVSTEYSIYADKARADGFIEIGNIFDITSRNEKEHARIWLRNLNSGIIPSTADNLNHCAQLEDQSGNHMYRDFAKTARDEGYDNLAALFNGVANIELNHNQRFLRLSSDVTRDEVFCKEQENLWICMQCGNVMSGICAPEVCPVCGFPQSYYRLYESGVD
jgi:rubrerythrin